MRKLLLLLIALSNPMFGADSDDLVGTWKLVSWQVITDNGPPRDVFGAHPKGFLILTRDGRIMVLTTAEKRLPGMGDAERAALHKSMIAYSGRFRVEGHDFITTVEVSWNEEWNGTEQRRHFRTATGFSLSQHRDRAYYFRVRRTSERSCGNGRNKIFIQNPLMSRGQHAEREMPQVKHLR